MVGFTSTPRKLALIGAGTVALVLDGVFAHGSSVPLAAVIALAVATSLPLTYMDRRPLASVLVLEALLSVCVLTFHAYDAAGGILAVVLFLTVVRGDRRRSLIVGVATAVVLTLTVAGLRDGAPSFDMGTLARVLIVLGAIVLGDAVRSRRSLALARAERVAREKREQEERARRRVERERLRIAQELHDTLAHALVGINVRAGVAAHLANAGEDTGALAEIKDVSARALADLRTTLDVLRDGTDETPLLPDQGFDSIPELIESARSTGLDAGVQVSVDGGEVATSVEHAAFRIVQEALTNVLRHADARHAEVVVAARPGTLAVEIVDDGAGEGRPRSGTEGHGLRGMSERATALGGTLTAGPLQPNGWRVLAELPLRNGSERSL